MAEPSVQVPVSMLRRIERGLSPYAGRAGRAEALIEVSALLSQRTPTAEHKDMSEYAQNERRHRQAILDGWAAAPPSIAGMVPGTTFTAEMRGGPADAQEWVVTSYGSVAVRLWTPGFSDRLDPSTIRDVTLPKDAS